MSQIWKKTQSLFSNFITSPPLKEIYLKMPSPIYIFSIIINTMKITGFSIGFFLPEQERHKYISSDINHQKIICLK
jgi:hypothetical protein